MRRMLLKIAAITISSNGITTAICVFQLSNTFTGIDAANVFDQLIPTCYIFALNVYLLLRLRLSAMPEPTFTRSQEIWVRSHTSSSRRY